MMHSFNSRQFDVIFLSTVPYNLDETHAWFNYICRAARNTEQKKITTVHHIPLTLNPHTIDIEKWISEWIYSMLFFLQGHLGMNLLYAFFYRATLQEDLGQSHVLAGH